MATAVSKSVLQPKSVVLQRPATPGDETLSRAPLPYRGDWYGLMVWVFGAAVLIFLHLVDIYRSIVGP